MLASLLQFQYNTVVLLGLESVLPSVLGLVVLVSVLPSALVSELLVLVSEQELALVSGQELGEL